MVLPKVGKGNKKGGTPWQLRQRMGQLPMLSVNVAGNKAKSRRRKTRRVAKRATTAQRSAQKTTTARSITSGNGKVEKARKPRASSLTGVKVGKAYYFSTDVVRVNVDQPREGKDYEYIRDNLAPSIERRGQSNPGKVYMIPKARGKVRFEVVGGENRYWACERVGIPFWAVVVSVKDAQDLFVQSFEDNEGVKQYTDREKTSAIVRMRDKYKMSWDDICDRMGGSTQPTVKTYYNLGKMPIAVQNMVATKSIPKSVITELAAVGSTHILATAKKIQGLPATDAFHEIRRTQERYGRQSSDSVARKRKTSDDRKLYEHASQHSQE